MTTERAAVAILGAGIAGCSLAYHLAGRQVGPVVVFDPSTPAAGASGRAAGIVTEQLWNLWDVEVARATIREYAELARERDPSAFAVNGFARFTRDPVATRVLAESRERMRGWNVDVDWIGAEELHAQVPEGRFDDVQGALVSYGDGVVTPSTMTEIYAAIAQERGVEFRFGAPIDSVAAHEHRWSVSSAGGTVRAERLVIAAGAWTKRIVAELGHPLPLCPYRTQAAVLRPAAPRSGLFPSVHDIDRDVYARPEANGRILAGDGTEHVEADPERFRTGGDESFVANLAECFQDRFPGWASAELVRAWAGVCTSTPDRRPLIGPVRGAEGLYVLTGFNGFGVMRAAGAAQRLAGALVAGDGSPSALDPLAPVLPSRFPAGTPAFLPRPGFTLEAGDDPRF